MELSQTIYTLRTAKGLSQLELAEQLEVSVRASANGRLVNRSLT